MGNLLLHHPSLAFHTFKCKEKEGLMRKMKGKNLVRGSSKSTSPDLNSLFLFKRGYLERGMRRISAFPEREDTVRPDKHRTGDRCNILVLGMGSEFFGDDGVGVHALRKLHKESLPAGTELIEVSNHLMDALVALQRADRIIVLDALRAKEKPGSICRVSLLPGEISEAIPPSRSLDLFSALYLGGCYSFLDVVLIGMEPSVIDWSASLSEEVGKALPLMVQAAKDELTRPSLLDSTREAICFTVNACPDPFPEDLRRYG
jgi:hydrogenase maturation protease